MNIKNLGKSWKNGGIWWNKMLENAGNGRKW